MPVQIVMPTLAAGMTEGTLARWLKAEGDRIEKGEPIAEIETDKATMEMEAEEEGVLGRIFVPSGSSGVPVNTPVALMLRSGEDAGSLPTHAETGAITAAEVGTVDKDLPDTESSEDAGRVPSPLTSQNVAEAAPSGQISGVRLRASPLARRLATEYGITLGDLAGSGPNGRIVRRDLEIARQGKPAEVEAQSAAPAPTAAPAAKPAAPQLAQSASADQVKAMFEAGTYEEVPLDGMRKTIAKRLVESKQTVPHFYLSLDCELDALMALREQINAAAGKDKDGKPAYKLSVNDFVIKALAIALQRVPSANAVWAEDRILKMKHSDVGVAVAIEGGLFTPVVRKAEQKTLTAISAEVKDMAGRARNRRLKPEEYSGGSTAVSNLGMFGIKNFQAVINPPQGTILAVGAGESRVVVKNGAPTVVQAMTVTLSCDHRVVDGALGAELLAAFKGLIESPMGMLV